MTAATTSAFDRVITALENLRGKVRVTGDRATAQCPAHDDGKPSLSVARLRECVGVYCHAGCETSVVVEALGLKLADLFDNRSRLIYPYRGRDGRINRVVSRTPDKRFRQYANLSENGRPIGRLAKDSKPVLYQCAEVATAVAAGRPVVLTEGEKDAETAALMGQVGTTAPMGATNFDRVDVEPLDGADVIAVVDRDSAGMKWAQTVLAALSGRAKSVSFVHAAKGKDLTDHYTAGLGMNDLQPVTIPEAVALPSATVVQLDTVRAAYISWLWPGRLPRGKVVVIDGDPSVSKSTFSNDLTRPVTTGSPWPDGAAGPTPAGVLLLSAEDDLPSTVVPRLLAAGADLSRVHALTAVAGPDGAPVPPSLPRDIPVIGELIRQHGIALVVVDVFMAYLSGGVDAHRDQDVRVVLHQLAEMADSTGACIVLIRHMNKSGGSNALYRGGGSIGIVGAARAAFLIARDPEDPDRRIFSVTKMNIAKEPPSLAFRVASDPVHGVARLEWEPDPWTSPPPSCSPHHWTWINAGNATTPPTGSKAGWPNREDRHPGPTSVRRPPPKASVRGPCSARGST